MVASGLLIVLLLLIAVVVGLILFVVGGFNKLRRADIGAQEALGGIDVQLTRRAELIPNLVNTVIEAVTAARSRVQAAAQAGNVGEKAAADAELSKALVNVIAVAEAYPDLKANTQFLDLQRQLADTENQLAFARQYYNDAVTKLNSMTQTVPWMFLTGMAGVSKREFYKAPEGQQAPPTVDFGTGPSAPGAPAAPGQLPAPAPYTGSDAPITQPNQAPANPLDP